jgi:hypothetical protein
MASGRQRLQSTAYVSKSSTFPRMLRRLYSPRHNEPDTIGCIGLAPI